MGIARRKAGTVVRCPTCSGQVVVPAAEASTAQGGSSASQNPAPVLFERQDFDQLFGPATTSEPRKEAEPMVPKKSSRPLAPDVSLDVDLLPAPPVPRKRPPGIHLSPLLATLIGVVFLILLALAFFLGYFFGSGGGA
jgi:hypothetical protein